MNTFMARFKTFFLFRLQAPRILTPSFNTKLCNSRAYNRNFMVFKLIYFML